MLLQYSAPICLQNLNVALLYTPGNSGPALPFQTDGVPYSVYVTALNGTGPFTLLAGPSGMTLTNVDSTHFLLQNSNPTGTGAVTVTVQSTT
jgi:hypothetical protein